MEKGISSRRLLKMSLSRTMGLLHVEIGQCTINILKVVSVSTPQLACFASANMLMLAKFSIGKSQAEQKDGSFPRLDDTNLHNALQSQNTPACTGPQDVLSNKTAHAYDSATEAQTGP